jgi:hypothetical protein
MTIINCWPFPVHLPMPASVLIRGLVTQQQLSIGRTTTDEEALNTSVRKFLKKLGVTAQREIEMAVRDADAKGLLKGSDPLPAKAVVTVGGIDLKFEIDGDIELVTFRGQCTRRTTERRPDWPHFKWASLSIGEPSPASDCSPSTQRGMEERHVISQTYGTIDGSPARTGGASTSQS